MRRERSIRLECPGPTLRKRARSQGCQQRDGGERVDQVGQREVDKGDHPVETAVHLREQTERKQHLEMLNHLYQAVSRTLSLDQMLTKRRDEPYTLSSLRIICLCAATVGALTFALVLAGLILEAQELWRDGAVTACV